MKEFKILSDGENNIAVKSGWSWPGFFSPIIWGVVKGLYLLPLILVFFIILGRLIIDQISESNIILFINIILLIGRIVMAIYGNDWYTERLEKKRFIIEGYYKATNKSDALNLYFINKEEYNKKKELKKNNNNLTYNSIYDINIIKENTSSNNIIQTNNIIENTSNWNCEICNTINSNNNYCFNCGCQKKDIEKDLIDKLMKASKISENIKNISLYLKNDELIKKNKNIEIKIDELIKEYNKVLEICKFNRIVSESINNILKGEDFLKVLKENDKSLNELKNIRNESNYDELINKFLESNYNNIIRNSNNDEIIDYLKASILNNVIIESIELTNDKFDNILKEI
jgi:hypothetical protein